MILRNLKDYDFESIVKFLLRLIDPNIRIENGIKEDFPRIMQMLGYGADRDCNEQLSHPVQKEHNE